MAEQIGIYVSGLMILAIFSYLFKPNKFYSYVEHIYVGFGAAHLIVMAWQNIVTLGINPLINGKYIMLVPLAAGCLLYSRFNRSLAYLARIPLAFIVGFAAAVSIKGAIDAQFVQQIRATMLPLTSIDNVIMVVGTVCTLSFFLFIPLGKNSVNGVAKTFSPLGIMVTIGRATIMVAFGSAYGFVVMARLSYLVARLQFLLGSFIPIIPT